MSVTDNAQPVVDQTIEPEVTTPNDAVVENIGSDIQDQVAGQLSSENGEIVRTEPETAMVDNSDQPEQLITEEILPEVVEQQTAAADPFKAEEEAGLDIMGLINSPVGWAAGAGSLALLGGFAFMRRRKNKNEDIEDFSDLIDSGLNIDEQEFEEEVSSEEINHDPVFDESEYTEHDSDDIQTQTETVSADDSENELEDLIQEADVYIVYGLHDQAESEIKRAMMNYPNSAALHAKLLENYKAAGDAEAFEEATKTYMELEADDKQNHWDEICEWGSALLPDSKLYDSSAFSGIAAAGAGAAMVAGTAVAATTDKAKDMLSGMTDSVSDAINPEIDTEDLIEDTILDEFDEVDLTKDMEDFDDLDLDSVLDGDDSKVMDVADLSDDFEIDLDDDFESILDEKDSSVDVSDEVEDSIDDTDFLFDDDSLDDLLNADESKDIADDVNEAANLNLEN